MTEFVLKIVISKLMGRLDSNPVNNSGTKFRKRTLLCKYSLENLKFYVLTVKMALYEVAVFLLADPIHFDNSSALTSELDKVKKP